MLSILGSILGWLLNLITGRKESAGVAQGRAEQQVADAKADIDVIHRANVAAKKQEENPDAYDSNDLDARR